MKTCEKCSKSSFYKNGTCRICQQKYPKWAKGYSIEEFKILFPKEYENRFLNQLEKRKSTCLEKYDVENIQQLGLTKNKIQEKWKQKSSEEIQRIVSCRQKTCLQKYNVSNPFQIPEIRQKALKSLKSIKRCKKEYTKKNRNILLKVERTIKTCLQKYNVSNPFQIPEIRQKALKGLKRNYINYVILENLKSIVSDNVTQEDITKLVELTKASRTTVLRQLKRQNIKINYSYRQKYEDQIFDFIKQYNRNLLIIQNQKHFGINLDIFIPELKLAIEFNGDYWHSIDCKHREISSDYHLNKTNICEKNNIRLLHIWEHEWKNNQEQVKEILLQYLNNQLPENNYNELSRDYFSVLDFSNCDIKEPILENHNGFNIYKTGFLIKRDF